MELILGSFYYAKYFALFLIFYAVFSYIALSVLYASYVGLMDLIKYHGKSKWWIKLLIVVFYLYDIFCNVFIVSFWSFQIPMQLTVTARLKLWKQYAAKGFYSLSLIQQNRLLIAIWACETKLDRDDVLTGNHC